MQKKQLIEASDTISTNGQVIDGLNEQIAGLQAQLEEAKNSQEAVATQIESYEKLLDAYIIYTTGDAVATGEALATIDTSLLSENALNNYNTLNDAIYNSYMEQLYNRAYSSYGRGDNQAAIDDFLKIIAKDQNFKDGSAVYYLAQAYRRNNDLETAKQYYQYVIDNFPGTEKARTAKNYVNAQN